MEQNTDSIIELIKINRISTTEVADCMGISQSYISRLEKRIIARLRREITRMS